MARSIEYRGFTITKSGRQSYDYRCTFEENGKPRTRFGTVEELKNDCDLVADGIGLPAPERGFA
jgi:hypothetical protein